MENYSHKWALPVLSLLPANTATAVGLENPSDEESCSKVKMRFAVYYLAGMLKIDDVFDEPRLHLRLEDLDSYPMPYTEISVFISALLILSAIQLTRGKTVAWNDSEELYSRHFP